jgi:hypothetical protein
MPTGEPVAGCPTGLERFLSGCMGGLVVARGRAALSETAKVDAAGGFTGW